jgi:AraC-like DNA-binding protein
MSYENVLYPQNSSIKQYIHSFWILKTGCSNIPYLLPPDKYFHVILSFKSNTHVVNNDFTKTPISGCFLIGMRTSRVFLSPGGDIDYLGIQFHPYGLRSFLDFHCINITDSFVEINLLKNKLYEALKPVINEAFSDQQKVEVIERRLLNLLAGIDYTPEKYLIAVLDRIEKNNGLITVRELSDNTGVATRRLNREFERFIGVSPKFYSRIVRFNFFLEKLKLMEKAENLSDLAYRCGYSDQSHMIHECSDFTGLPPKELFDNCLK